MFDRPGTDVRARHCTTQQSNTHNIKSGQVHYPWHPWSGRAVSIQDQFIKRGQALCRCRLDQEGYLYTIELPQWMLDRAVCGRMLLAEAPAVSGEVLRELRSLLDQPPPQDPERLLQARHHSLRVEETADATFADTIESPAIRPVSAFPDRSGLPGVTTGGETGDGAVTRPPTARPSGPTPGGGVRPGGER